MENEAIRALADYGSTVLTVGMFLWYLVRKDHATQQALNSLTRVIHELLGRARANNQESDT